MIAIVAALETEVAGFLSLRRYREAGRQGRIRWFESPSARGAPVIVGGAGRENAAAATRFAVERYAPELIVSAGFAGGLRPELRPGDLVLCENVWSVEGPPERWTPETALSRSLPDPAALPRGLEVIESMLIRATRMDCLSVPRVVAASQGKRWIGSRFPVGIVDMESYWVTDAAARLDVPAIVVRSVVDPVEQNLPPFPTSAAAGGGAAMWVQALKLALSRPRWIPGLVKLAAHANAARGALAEALDAIASGDHEPAYAHAAGAQESNARPE